MRESLLAFVAVLATAAALTAAATAAPPQQSAVSTLTGEQLAAFFQPCSDPNGVGEAKCFTNPEPAHVHATCDPNGTSTLTLDTTGVAVGPYPGTFSASIKVQIGPQTGPVVPQSPIGFPSFPGIQEGSIGFQTGELASVTETFHIDSPATGTTADGTKYLLADAGNFGVCQEFQNETPVPANPFFPIPITGYFYLADMNLLGYDATLTTPTGRYSDEGTASAYVDNTFATCCDNTIANSSDGLFVQMFTSSLSFAEELKPGEGCGDTNHAHERSGECK